MAQLIFKASDVRRVVEHSIKAPQQAQQLVDYNDDGPVTEPVEGPAVLLVHDDGVYLMSNGKPRDIVQADGEFGAQAAKEGRSYVAHAKGCNPKTDNEWWNTSRDLVGGDDFSETLPWAREIKRAIDGGAKTVVVHMTSNKMWLTFRK